MVKKIDILIDEVASLNAKMNWMQKRFSLDTFQNMNIPTVKISDGKGGFIVINESDYNEKTQKLFVEPVKETPPAETKKTKKDK